MKLTPFTRLILKLGILLGVTCVLLSRGLNAEVITDTNYGRKSEDCRSCHSSIYESWNKSHHALAHRAVDLRDDSQAFEKLHDILIEGVHYHSKITEGTVSITENRLSGTPYTYLAAFVMGTSPLRQYIIPTGNGRYQANELAYDPHKKEWFNVFGSEHRLPGEWGQWQGRGMNWNSMCAQCHLTDFSKNYNPLTDSYSSHWTEHGVGCIQCHGDLDKDHAKKKSTNKGDQTSLIAKRKIEIETCAPCHARNEALTGEPRAGMKYSDHFRLTLPTEASTFYPDGQMKDEDFNWTSFQTSRMGGKASVSCLDCHDPHSNKTLLSASNNALCLQCHVANNLRNAPVIDPVSHSHHIAGSTGNLCINCHMPTTTYMQRDPRHDHGFLRPDPLLTKELGIPNACNKCHSEKSVDWQIAATNTWYGVKMDSRQRSRARAINAAQKGIDHSEDALLKLIVTEDIPAWRATLILLTRPWAVEPSVRSIVTALLKDEDPLVRSAAVQVLGTQGDLLDTLTPYLKDESRLVRVDTEWALSSHLEDTSKERKELNAYLAVSSDQPAGQVRIAEDLFNRGHIAESEVPLRKAILWDSNAAEAHHTLGLVLDNLNRQAEAAESLWRAAELDSRNAVFALQAGLEFAGSSKVKEAEKALKEAVLRDPGLDRAWYNLGLLLNQDRSTHEALDALAHAEQAAPGIADYPYAVATILWQQGDHISAKLAAKRALSIDPNHRGARSLINEH